MSSKQPSQNVIEISILAVVLLGLGYSMFAAWQAMQEDSVAALPTATNKAKGAAATPGLPVLVLHNAHQRAGQAIEVDPAKIGRSDPFLAP